MLIHGPSTLELMLERLSGADGYFDDFELAFFTGYDPRYISGASPADKIASWSFSSPWAYTYNNSAIAAYGPIATTAIKGGAATFWELLATKSGTPYRLLHGTAGKKGSGADIVFTNHIWAMGDTITLNAIYLYPLKLSYT